MHIFKRVIIVAMQQSISCSYCVVSFSNTSVLSLMLSNMLFINEPYCVMLDYVISNLLSYCIVFSLSTVNFRESKIQEFTNPGMSSIYLRFQ